MVSVMKRGLIIVLILTAGGPGNPTRAQETDGDAWYYERIAVQDRPVFDGDNVPSSWQDLWSPVVRELREEIAFCLEIERELPRLRFELQGDRSNKFALFRCLDEVGDYSLSWKLERAESLDDLFLLPTRIPQADGTIRRLGFPLRSRIELSESGSFEKDARVFEVPASSNEGVPGFPVRVSLDGKPARAWRWIIDEPYAPFRIGYLALSEIFVLSGEVNVAPEATLSWSQSFLPDRSMAPAFLQDEKTPLGLPLIREETAVLGYHSEIKELTATDEEWIELSWSVPQEISAIRLIPSQQRVLPHTETFGFPLAHRTDYFLGNEELGSRRVRYEIDPGQNVITIPGVPNQKVDRVRWVATELWQRRNSRFLSLAEFEVLGGNGKNIAPVAELKVSSPGIANAIWNRDALTDGLASEGRLISAGAWLRGLDEAKEVRAQRLSFTSRLERTIRATNRFLLGGLLVMLGLVAFGFALSWWRIRKRSKLESSEFRKQLAADLHDDLGGNLGSIVLLADQLRGSQAPESEAAEDLGRVVELARESRNQLRTILDVSDETHGLSMDADSFVNRLRLTIQDFFGKDHGYLTIPDDGGKTISLLSERQRGGVLLFCKEALHNLSQHSEATRVLVQLEPSKKGVTLRIEDNSPVAIAEGGVLLSKSLQRRGQRLADRIEVDRFMEGSGNSLTLEISTATAS